MVAYALQMPRPLKQPTSQLAKNLREYRAKAGMSQETLAAKSGVSRATIANIERTKPGEEPNPEYETIVALASALGVRPTDLLGLPAGTKDLESVIRRFVASPWNGQFLKPPATEEELAWLRSLSAVTWIGREPTEESIAKMIEAIRSMPPKPAK